MSARDAHDLAEYLFDAEGVESCSVVRDARRPDPLYYVCRRGQDAFLVLMCDRFTSPGIETLLVEKNIEASRISAVSASEDEEEDEESSALNIYIALSELYSPSPAVTHDVILQKLIESTTYLLPTLAERLRGLKRDDILSPSQLAADHKVRLLVKAFEDLHVEQEDIQRAMEIYLLE